LEKVWLDKGEIEKILERGGKKKKHKSSISKQLAEGLDAGLTANLDSIIDALISAF